MTDTVDDKENCLSSSNIMDTKETLECGPQGGSLQDAFAKFRNRKMKEKQLIKASRRPPAERSPEYKAALRLKFVEQCKKYLGVPYSERYKAPEDPVAPLYLDCCGLVRKVLQDLQDDFGFVTGMWNQAYQMDTLPIEVPFEEAKPGDLVFWCGQYTSKRSKKQKHDCLHIEVFLGGETGKATIGARYFRGKVSIFDSYEFTSTAWTPDRIFVRSLDTWLNGEMRSHCPEHPWEIPDWKLSKKSIFECAEDEEDISAGGDEEGEETETEATKAAADAGTGTDANRGESEEGSAKSEIRDCGGSSDKKLEDQKVTNTSDLSGSAGKANTKKPSRARSNSKTSQESTSSADTQGHSSAVEKKVPQSGTSHTYYVGKSNGWRLVKSALDKRLWQQIPFEYKFSQRFSLKWVERRSDIDYRSHNPGQLVCHIPNNDCITTKSGLLNTLRLYEVSTVRVKKPPAFSPVKPDPLLRSTSLNSKSPAANKPPCSDHVENTSGTSATTRTRTTSGKLPATRLEILATDAEHIIVPWMPDTYALDSPADINALLQCETNHVEAGAAPGMWIYKPSASNRGHGIKVVWGIEELKVLCHGVQTNHPDTTIAPARGIVQRYIENPLLARCPFPTSGDGVSGAIDSSSPSVGHKFDIRCFLLIARNDPSYLAYYCPGYCRLALSPYTCDAALSDDSVHLTNASVQRKHVHYSEKKEFQVQTVEQLASALDENPDTKHNAEFLRNGLEDQIKKCLVHVLKASASTLMRKRGFFDLLGCDFMVTADNQLRLLEINSNPAMSTENSVLASILPDVIEHCLTLVLSAQGPDLPNSCLQDPTREDKKHTELHSPPGNYSLIFDENSKYEYSGAAVEH